MSPVRWTWTLWGIFGALLIAGCGSSDRRTVTTFPIALTAATDDGEPLADVEFSLAEGALTGKTDQNGLLQLTVDRPEGTVLPVKATCPEGYDEAPSLSPLTLRSFQPLQGATADIRLSIECTPSYRTVAVLVRAPDIGDLPILVNEIEKTRTDASGAAHLVAPLPARTSFRVTIDTTSRPDIRPISPSRAFTVPESDEIFVFDQVFQVPEPEPEPEVERRPRRRRQPRPERHVIRRID